MIYHISFPLKNPGPEIIVKNEKKLAVALYHFALRVFVLSGGLAIKEKMIEKEMENGDPEMGVRF